MDVLAEIVARKRERVAQSKEVVSPDQVRRLAAEARREAKPHALRRALASEGINIIAEFKRRSPSKGKIRSDANLLDIVQGYEAGGAVGISVLTEEDYFDGSLDDLRNVKANVKLPILRKDFVFEEYQVYESAAAGADAILLIVAALDEEALTHLRRVAEDELRMDALVEVHDSDELKRAADCGARLIGVNNRDLRTFAVSLQTSFSLVSQMPEGAIPVSESGLHDPEDLRRLHEAGYRGFLIGETLMRANDPAETLHSLSRGFTQMNAD